ncbi:RCC1 domain-containing protein [Peredibacter sp. HCB2-198]|uniref:RCC1 domain-containing protein n=1 Tax=Peredibacter sp. HCB2-198 TaxID=3383025 RepID=UPI0038B6237F
MVKLILVLLFFTSKLWAQNHFRQIILEPNTTCVADNHGKLYCWGTYSAKPGDFLGSDSTPKTINVFPKVTSIQMGDSIACALSDDGQVKCWGNDRGEEVLPQLVKLPGPVSKIYVRQYLQCAYLKDGDLYCWRQFPNTDDKTDKKAIEPTKISLPASIDKFFDSQGLCVLLDNGNLWCWDSYHIRPEQKMVPGISIKDVMKLADYYYVTNEGKVLKETGKKLVVFAGLENGVKSLKSNYGKYCAIMEIGTIKCDGVEVPGITDAVDVEVMSDVTCALLKDGRIKCWGGGFNFLGNGDQSSLPPYDFTLPKTK